MVTAQELFKLASDNPACASSKHAACVIDKRGNVLAFGFNQYKSHPLQARFSRNDKSIFLHAEIDAIKNALRRCDNLVEAKIKVVRVYKNGKPALSKPCVGCLNAAKHFCLSSVSWSLPNGNMETQEL